MFKQVIERLSKNKGFFDEYGACLFWEDLDDYDREITPYYDGVEFGLHSGEEGSYKVWKLITKEGYITMAVCITVMGMLLMM